MRNTFIIKNADSSFDNYYHMMKLKQKRMTLAGGSFNAHAAHSNMSPSKIANMHSDAKGLQ
eukprot:CAMPEP_0176378730 /NCGR_PEP_ID=MMETSP0126-20121128/29833_1 /TAXON_ID=141414 ORGANISM="Strombidinopsis acuminatum, Strain SPMC142" /NCGR_SAMPLE_ID=MMETSP0126 /ASSEMBLY_ACC=CAM_ASM_000229 /LENGTH=60 /DNA_ID=CAMNT_0017741165 /DNA_START=1387 /DNA_END=1569 /DNA_ORIENTATION=+